MKYYCVINLILLDFIQVILKINSIYLIFYYNSDPKFKFYILYYLQIKINYYYYLIIFYYCLRVSNFKFMV